MSVSVITLTRGDRQALLVECAQSVATALPEGGRHVIADGRGEFQRTRFDSTVGLGGYVAWVDDDDLVCNDALGLCAKALDESGAGIAFTFESGWFSDGSMLATDYREKSLRDVAMHPQAIHHLAMVNTACLDPVVLAEAQRIGTGIDWLMRAYAALKHGAVQVPVIGYQWRQHDEQESRTVAWNLRYTASMRALREVTNRWMTHDAPIRRILAR